MLYFSRQIRRFIPVSLMCCLVSVLAGCGVSISRSSIEQTGGIAGSRTLTGLVMGGNQPIVGATVNLYSMGTTGYGSAGTLLATTTTVGSNATFSFTQNPGTGGAASPVSSTYQCPSSNTQLYIVARGGATQGTGNGTNSAAVLTAAIGECGSASSVYVNINEVTSVATMAALQQYFHPASETFGSPNSPQGTLALANNVSLIANMVTLSSGTANTSSVQSGTPLGNGTLTPSAISVTVTPEYNQINTIANVLADCVNTASSSASVSSACGTLFMNATPPNPSVTSQPTQSFATKKATKDVLLQALYFMLTNPTGAAGSTTTNTSGANIAALYTLASAQAAFQPYYPSAPTDWTIGISYTSKSTCNSSVGSAYPGGAETTTTTAAFAENIADLAIDASGNVWGVAYNPTDLFEVSPTGIPLTCGLGSGVYKPQTIAIDPAGYVWVANRQSISSNFYLFKWNPATGTSNGVDSSWSTGVDEVVGLTIDGSGNVFYSYNYTSGSPSVTYTGVSELPLAGVAGANPASISANILATGIAATGVTELQVDSSDALWLAEYGGTGQVVDYIYPNSSGTGYSFKNIADTDTLSPRGLAIGQTSTGTTTVNMAGGTWQSFLAPATAGGTPTVNFETASGTDIAGLLEPGSPHSAAVDGAGNIWADCAEQSGNYVTSSTTAAFALCEISATGANISATSVSSSKSHGGFQKPSALIPAATSGVVVDPSGNVWAGTSGAGLFELVGAAVPLSTPLSAAVGKGDLGVKP
jgi:hypothetical protein